VHASAGKSSIYAGPYMPARHCSHHHGACAKLSSASHLQASSPEANKPVLSIYLYWVCSMSGNPDILVLMCPGFMHFSDVRMSKNP